VTAKKIQGVKWLTREQFEEMLEERCYRILGVTLAQFRKNCRKGKYRKENDSRITELMMLVKD
jgi:hypothetical protein